MNLTIFKNSELGDIRTVRVNDQVMFVAKDVSNILGYKNSYKEVTLHTDEEDRCKVMVNDGTQNREYLVITEAGLYSLILTSRMPKAKECRKWIFSTVLPAARKNEVV